MTLLLKPYNKDVKQFFDNGKLVGALLRTTNGLWLPADENETPITKTALISPLAEARFEAWYVKKDGE